MNQLSLKKNLKRVLPDFILLLGRKVLLFLHFLLSIKRKYELKKHYSDVHKRYRYNLHNLNMKMTSGNEKIRCVYFALFPSIWKCDEMYQIMKNDDRFEPLVLVCPIINHGRENMLQNMEDCYNQMKEKGYNLYATGGTSKYLAENGIENTRVYWPSEEGQQPQALDLLHEKKIDMVVNIPKDLTPHELTNGYKIRRAAIDLNVPLITNSRLASSFINAFTTLSLDDIDIKAWGEY